VPANFALLTNLKEFGFSGGSVENFQLCGWNGEFSSRLEIIKMPHSFYAINTGLGAMIKNTPRLRYLEMGSASVSEHTLRLIAACCPDLCELELVRCEKITRLGLQAIINACRRLKRLQLRGCGRRYGWFPSELVVAKYRKIVFFKD